MAHVPVEKLVSKTMIYRYTCFMHNVILKSLMYASKGVQGKTFVVRKCQPNAVNKAGTCDEEHHVLNQKTRLCYCNTAGCNGTSHIRPFSYAAIFMLLGFSLFMK